MFLNLTFLQWCYFFCSENGLKISFQSKRISAIVEFLTAQWSSSEMNLKPLWMWNFGKSVPFNIVRLCCLAWVIRISLKLGKLNLVFLISILWYLNFKFGTTNALSLAIFSGCELDDTLNETVSLRIQSKCRKTLEKCGPE